MRMLSKWSLAAVASLGLLVSATRAEAVSISLLPSSPSVTLGNTISIDIVIADLGIGVPPTVAAFDLDVSFLASVLSFVSADFGDDLGILGIETLAPSVNLLAGPTRVDLALQSLLPNATLDANQPSTFVLATLHFVALAEGESPLAITQAVLANTAGGGIGATRNGASVTVLPVPEPSIALLLALGLGGLGLRRRAEA